MSDDILHCAACGAENSMDNRFCGMCGRSLVAIPAPEAAATRTAPPAGNVQRSPARPQATPSLPSLDRETSPSEPIRITPIDDSPREPAYSEPAAPAPAYTGGLFRLGAEPDRPSRNLDYLLEDDEPRSHSGLFIGLTLIALLLAGGLGYLRFRNGSLPNLIGGIKSAAKPSPPASDSNTTGSTSSQAAPAPDTSAVPLANQPPASAPNTSAAAAPPPLDGNALSDVRPANPAESTQATPPPAIAPAAATKGDEEPEAPPKPAPAAKPAPPKPAPKPEDPVVLGEKYIYGRGVPQDCARGLKTVKPAAEQANLKAMITMGALYATGHCVSLDLPTAYRYFALSLRRDPENAALKQNLEMVWAKMTQSERQQAIRLTQ